jgi:hypothetical protein
MFYHLPSLSHHFKSHKFDIMPFMNSCWIQLFMHWNSQNRETILDHFFVNGPIVFLKSMIVILQIEEKAVLKLDSYALIYSHMDKIFTEETIDCNLFSK